MLDFHYEQGTCVERIPLTGQTVVLDIDTHCAIAASQYFMTCANMWNYAFTGISFFDKCQPARYDWSMKYGAKFILDLRETCDWVCKHNRPVGRCKWNFTHPAANTERLERCWISETCNGGAIVMKAACKPLANFNASKELRALREDLAAAKLAHHAATSQLKEINDTFARLNMTSKAEYEQALEEARAAHDLAKDQLAAVATELNRTQEKFDTIRESHAEKQRTNAELARSLEEANAELQAARAMISQHAEEKVQHRNREQKKLRDLMMEVDAFSRQSEFNQVRTALAAEAIAGSATVQLADVSSMAPGMMLTISDTQHIETKRIVFVARRLSGHSRRLKAGSVTLDSALRYSYAAGASVKAIAAKATSYASRVDVDSRSHERPVLIVLIVVLGLMLIACAAVLSVCAHRQRKWRLIALKQAGEMGADVVVGRPIDNEDSSGPSNEKKNFNQADDGMKPTVVAAPTFEYKVCRQNSSPKAAWT